MVAYLGKLYHKAPSDMVDPFRERLTGMARIMFDGAVAASTVTEERLASGDTDGISVAEQVAFERRKLDTAASEEFEQMKRNLRRR